MMININWENLRTVHEELIDSGNLKDDSDIVFTMILSDGKAKKSIVKFKDFMSVFWAISENKDFSVLTLVVQDKEGRILYRHKQLTQGNEEIPDGGNAGVVQNWNALTEDEKSTYMRMLIAQIEGYEQ